MHAWLTQHDYRNAPFMMLLRALVFLVIAGTVVIAGALAWPLSASMGLRLPARDRIAILGAQGLGRALGRALLGRGASVVFIDADPQRCREAEAEGLPVVFGDGLQERTLRRLPIELVGTVAGATYNDNLNSQFVRFARQAFGVQVGLVSVDSLDGGQPPEHVKRAGADLLFGGPSRPGAVGRPVQARRRHGRAVRVPE